MRILLIALCVAISFFSFAQTVDPTFAPKFRIPGDVFGIAPAAGNKIIVTGFFNYFNNTAVRHIARLNADGSVDETFSNHGGPDWSSDTELGAGIAKAVEQADGKILVVGDFHRFDGVPRYNIARLNADGSLDQSFVPPAKPTGVGQLSTWDRLLVVQPDGKILTGIISYTSNGGIGTSDYKIVRLNTDGSIDDTFAVGKSTGGISDIALQQNGKILLTGPGLTYSYTTPDGTFTSISPTSTFRLNTDGTYDDTFNIGTDMRVDKFFVRPDGNIVVSQYDVFGSKVGQLNSDGSFSNVKTVDLAVSHITTDAAGLIIVSGWNDEIRRLKGDGSTDKSFVGNPGEINDIMFDVVVLGDGKLLAGGRGSNGGYNFVKLNSDFTIDNTFSPGLGPVIRSLAENIFVQPDGKILLIGGFKFLNGVQRGGIARLNSDLSEENTYNPGGLGLSQVSVQSAAMKADGKVVLYTQSKKFNGLPFEKQMMQLNIDGTKDNTFSATTPSDPKLLTTTNNKTLAYGNYVNFNGNPQTHLVRLNSNGSNDDTFVPKFDAGIAFALAMKNGKVVIAGGDYTKLNNVAAPKLLRLNEDGTPDVSFVPKIDIANSTVYNAQETSDGKVMLFGSIAVNEGGASPKYYVAVRLLDNGDLDGTFTKTESTANLRVQYGHILSDKSFFVSTDLFQAIRFFPNGEPTSYPKLTANGLINHFTQLSPTSLIVSGGFSIINDVATYNAKVTIDEAIPPAAPTGLTASLSQSVVVTLTWATVPNATKYEIEISTGAAFQKIGESTTTTYVANSLDEKTSYKFRVKAVGPGGYSNYSNEAAISTTTGLGDEADQISVYPNPANEFVYVTGDVKQASLLDSVGRTIGVYNNEGGRISIDLSHVDKGIYIVKVKTKAIKIIRN